jgi:hypothetical protein
VDGVCCDSACDGQCEACNESGHSGECIPTNGAPKGGRAPCQGVGQCAGTCDGAYRPACVFPSHETVCGPSACVNGVEQSAAVCNTTVTCLLPTTKDCFPFTCDDSASGCAGA